MLKIWGREDALSVQKVMWCVREIGIEYNHIPAGRNYGLNFEPWYLEMNPNGSIPTVNDDGFVLWESNSIVKYLCAKHSMGVLCPSDPREFADADRWMTWQVAELWRPMQNLLLNLVRTPVEKQDSQTIERLVATTNGHWSILDKRLSDRPYIMGAGFTMADIVFGPHLYRYHTYPIPRPNLRNVRMWYDRLREREHYRMGFTAGDIARTSQWEKS